MISTAQQRMMEAFTYVLITFLSEATQILTLAQEDTARLTTRQIRDLLDSLRSDMDAHLRRIISYPGQR
ncbi:MAG: hypothetical protein K6T83_07340 [Alicyclobacillus sp.]|nr:hypothetical protein [Alicyclobacillus sp.]